MIHKSDWYRLFTDEFEKATYTRRESKLFNIERFIKSAGWIEYFSTDCPFCNNAKPDMLYAAQKIANMGGVTGMGEVDFESLNDKIYHHLRNDHLLIPRSYFVAFYSLIGMVGGTIIGGVVGFIGHIALAESQGSWLKNGLLLGWFAGLVIGQILGKRKDNHIKKQGRQF